MAETLAARLTQVQAAIAAVEGGAQSYTAEDGRSLTYPPLQILLEDEKRILRLIEHETTRGRTVAEM